MSGWAIDLGNTHTRVATWDAAADAPRLVELPRICRQSSVGSDGPGESDGRDHDDDPLASPRLIPSATYFLDRPSLAARVGNWRFVRRRWFLGRQALIGRAAIEASQLRPGAGFVPTFKPFLERESLRPLARSGHRRFTARDVAQVFLRELLAEVHGVRGVRIRDVVLTAPVEAYEAYRAELLRAARALGIKRVRFADEPVAAAIGYGLDLSREHDVLVVDFGGGTFHMALVTITPDAARQGRAVVRAKEGRAIGGNQVNRWLLEEYGRRAGFEVSADAPDEEGRLWHQLMLAEACRVKEALFFQPKAAFHLTPPAHLRRLVPERDATALVEATREELVALLDARGVYRMLEECTQQIFRQVQGKLSEADLEDVLVVGGSTLLPEVYPFFERRFGRERVRAWQPFEAVAYGAAALAADSLSQSDFIVHDYAFLTYDARTHQPQYTVVVPRGTRFPTPDDFWKRQLIPTCSLGEPETFFKLVICEIGRGGAAGRKFVWDQGGEVHALGAGGAEESLVVPINQANPTLGELAPPHSPRDRRPRLEIAFGVNADRWLVATVRDLITRKMLLEQEPVVRLL